MAAGIPLTGHGDHAAIFAYRQGRPVTVAQFIGAARQLAARLPEKKYVLNVCTDRYLFALGFAAALLRGQVSLFPPNHTPDLVAQLKADYPGLYCLSDAGHQFPGVETLIFPELGELARRDEQVPIVPAGQCAALVFTSGSTGRPVAHAKSWGGLSRDGAAEAVALGLADKTGYAVLGTVPPQHMYGLESTVLLPMQGGQALVAERPFYAADILAQLNALPEPRCLVTTPVHLRILLAEAEPMPAVAFILSATAPLAEELAKEAEARFGAPLHEIYGCTEAGQVACRQTARSSAWRPLEGIGLRQDAEARTWVSGGHVETEVLLSDVIELGEDGTFLLHGRASDMVNIAGKRTSLGSLNHHLNAIAGVRDGVFVLPEEADDELGRPMAFVVAPGIPGATILKALRERIDPVFLPRPLYFVDALPRNATGKLTREAVRQMRHAHAVEGEGDA